MKVCGTALVLDGDVTHAAWSVRQKIVELRRDIALVGELGEDAWIDDMVRFVSRHMREGDGSEIEVRHALLSL